MKELSIFLGKCILFLLICYGYVTLVDMVIATNYDLTALAYNIIVLPVYIFPFFLFWISKTIWNKGEQLINYISNQIKKTVAMKKVLEATQKSKQEYNDAKSRFKYLSNDVLLNKYKEFQEKKLENIIRLALEEELVERKLITHSPMHNKLDFIMNK